VVQRSQDGGATWDSSTVVSDSCAVFTHDEPILRTGPLWDGSAAPADDAAYLSWTRTDVVGATNTIRLAGAPATTGGGTPVGALAWSSQQVNDGVGMVQLSSPSVGPDGAVYVGWADFTTGEIRFDTDPDGIGGPAPFGPDSTVAPFTLGFQEAIPAQPERGVSPAVFVATDRSGGPNDGRTYVVWTDNDGALSDDTDVFISFTDDPNNPLGPTFSAPATVHSPSAHSQFHGSVSVDQATGDVNVVYYDARFDPDDDGAGPILGTENDQVVAMAVRSTDGGETFGNEFILSAGFSNQSGGIDPPQDYLDYIGVASIDGSAFFAWADNSTNTPDLEVFFNAIHPPTDLGTIGGEPFWLDELTLPWNDEDWFKITTSANTFGVIHVTLDLEDPNMNGVLDDDERLVVELFQDADGVDDPTDPNDFMEILPTSYGYSDTPNADGQFELTVSFPITGTGNPTDMFFLRVFGGPLADQDSTGDLMASNEYDLHLLVNATAIIFGDQDKPGQDDVIRLRRNAADPNVVDVFINNETFNTSLGATNFQQIGLPGLESINVLGLGGDDILIIDYSNGPISAPGDWAPDIVFNGDGDGSLIFANAASVGGGFDVDGDGNPDFFGDPDAFIGAPPLDGRDQVWVVNGAATQGETIRAGAHDGQGQIIEAGLLDPAAAPGFTNTQHINYFNLDRHQFLDSNQNPIVLEPVFTNILADLTIIATPEHNAISYLEDDLSGVATTFFKEQMQTAFPGAGAAVGLVHVDDLGGFEFTNKSSVTVNGQAGSDEIHLAGTNAGLNPGAPFNVIGADPTAGSDHLIVNGVDATVAVDVAAGTITGAGPAVINFNTIEDLTVNGDASTTLAVSGSPDYTYEPGELIDEGTILTDVLDIDFEGFGTGDFIELTGTGAGEATINGTKVGDVFTVNASSEIQLNNRAQITVAMLPTVTLNGLDGEDTFNIDGAAALAGITTFRVNGGSPSGQLAGDTLNFLGNGGAIQIDLDNKTISETGGATVHFNGVEEINIDADGADVTVLGTPDEDEFDVRATGPNSAEFTVDGLNALFNLTDVGSLTIDALAGEDRLNFFGTANADTINADDAMVEVVGLLTVNHADFEALNIFAREGSDTINVTPGAIPIFVDGGNPIGVVGDTLNVMATAGVMFMPGPESDEGGFSFDAEADVSFDHIEALGVDLTNAGGAALIMGTGADDEITAQGTAANTVDVQVNDGPIITFTAATELTLQGKNGDDDITIDVNVNNLGVTFNVDGGLPTAAEGDELRVTGVNGFDDEPSWTPNSADGGVLQLLGQAPINVAAIERLFYDGESDNETLDVVGGAGDNEFVHRTGATVDSGFVGVREDGAELLGINYEDLGSAGSVNIVGAGGDDELIYEGTPASDVFGVDGVPVITLNSHIDVSTDGVEAYVLQGLGGGDTFNITAVPNVQITVEGDEPGNGDVLNFTSTGATIVDLGASEIEDAGVAGSPDVIYSGIETINLNANGQTLAVWGTDDDDAIEVTPFGGNAGRVQVNGQDPVVNYTNVLNNTITIDPRGGQDTLVVNATPGADNVTVDVPAGLVDTGANGGAVNFILANTDALRVNGREGNDSFAVTPGAIPVMIDGGDPIGVVGDTLNLVNLPGSPTFTPGPEPDEGGFTFDGAAEDVSFDHIEAITVDLSGGAAGAATIMGTGADDDITAVGVSANTVNVQVNAGPDAMFTSATDITLQGKNGDDDFTIDVNVQNLGVTFNVDGGLPTAGSDELRVTGVNGFDDEPSWTPNSADGGVLQLLGQAPINVAAIEHLFYDGESDDETLDVVGGAGDNEFVHRTGATVDSGFVGVRENGAELLGIAYEDLGSAGSVNIIGAGGDDELIYEGTPASDTFGVAGTPVITLNSHIDVSTSAVEAYRLQGLGGADTFNITAVPNVEITVEGDEPDSGDVLNFTSLGATTINLGDESINDAAVAPDPNVFYSGIETINLDAGGQALTVVGSDDDEDLTVTVFSATSGKIERGLAVQQNGQVSSQLTAPLIRYANLPFDPANVLTIDPAGGVDTVIVVGNALPQTFDVNVPAGTVNILNDDGDMVNDGRIAFVNATTESLSVFGLEGDDVFNVIPGPNIPVFIDGGDPIGVTGVLGGDELNVAFSVYFPGPESDEGALLQPGSAPVSFDHIERITAMAPDGVDDCPILIVGTNADDDITVIARDGSTHPGADGIQDFTVSVNGGPDILFLDQPDLFIDALSGDDDIVVRTRAPNGADWNVHVRIVGGAPSAATGDQGDVVEVETPGDAADSVFYTPTGSDTGRLLIEGAGGADTLIEILSTFTIFCPLPDPLEDFEYISSTGGAEHFIYDGEGGEGGDDEFTIIGTGGDDTIVHTPGEAIDEGRFRVNTLLAINYQNLGADATITVDGGDGDDTLVVDGTALSDTFTVADNTTPATSGAVTVENAHGTRLAIRQTAVENLTLNGLDGDDDFILNLTTPYTTITVNGGGPGASDTLTINGAAGTDETFTVNPGATRGDGEVTVDALTTPYTGIEHLFLAGNDGDDDDITINDDGADNLWTVDKGTVGDSVQIDDRESIDINDFNDVTLTNGFGTDVFRIHPTNLVSFDGAFTVNGDAAVPLDDVVQLIGTEGRDLVTSTADTITFNGVAITVGNNNFAEVAIFALGGHDNIVLALALPDVRKFVDAGAGNDFVDLSATQDAIILGGDGDDFLIGTPLSDFIDGGKGNDTIFGLGAADILIGGEGNDILVGGAGNDAMFGGDGSDILVWNPGDGNDLIEGGAGNDKLQFTGGMGNDTFTLRANGSRLRFERTPGNIVLDAAGIEEVDVDTSVTFGGAVTGDQENPPVATMASGFTTFVYDSDTNRFYLDVFIAGIAQADLTMSHIHVGAPGVNGGIIFDLGGGAAWTPQDGGLRRTLTDAEFPVANIGDLLAGNTYVNVHTTAFPGGEVRGQLNVVGAAPTANFAGADTFTVFDLTTTEVEVVNLGLGANNGGLNDAAADTVVVHGRTLDDDLVISRTDGPDGFADFVDVKGLEYDVRISNGVLAQGDSLTVRGNEGDDRIRVLDTLAAPVAAVLGITLEGDAGDDFLQGGAGDETLNGGDGNDFLSGGAGNDTLNGGAGEDTMVGGAGQDTYDGGDGFDTILIRGTSGADLIDVRQPNATTLEYVVTDQFGAMVENATIAAGTQDTIANVEEARVEAGAGADTIRVAIDDSLFDNPGDSLRMTVDGGDDAASDRLGIVDVGTDDLSILRQNHDITAGTVEIGPANAEPFLHVFSGIEFVQVLDDTLAPGAATEVGVNRLVVFKDDEHEHNNQRNNATHLGANQTINLSATIDPGPGAFGFPADNDWYRVEAEVTGTIDFQVFFEQIPVGGVGGVRSGLPGNGNLNVMAFDASGDPIAGFGAADATDNARIRIPAVQGQIYFFQVVGAAGAINAYDVTVINHEPPTPFDLELKDRPVGDTPGGPFDNSDTGRSQFDNVTRDTTPTIFLRLDDAILLNDLPGNAAGTPGAPPPDEVIPIPHVPSTAASPVGLNPGFRVAIFLENNTHSPVMAGFAQPATDPDFATMVEPGVYQFTTPSVLADGEPRELVHLTPRVQMLDPADNDPGAPPHRFRAPQRFAGDHRRYATASGVLRRSGHSGRRPDARSHRDAAATAGDRPQDERHHAGVLGHSRGEYDHSRLCRPHAEQYGRQLRRAPGAHRRRTARRHEPVPQRAVAIDQQHRPQRPELLPGGRRPAADPGDRRGLWRATSARAWESPPRRSISSSTRKARRSPACSSARPTCSA
jgi:Ca2+-binding RTX toxin-like protein